MFFCNRCNYSTDRKWNFNQHLKSKKHIEKNRISLLPIQKLNNTVTDDKLHCIYTCEYCNATYSRLDNKQRHLSRCIQKKLVEKENLIKSLSQTNYDLIKRVSELATENKELNSKIQNIAEKQLALISNKPKNNYTTNTQIIINNYPNAPNLIFPEIHRSPKTIQDYIKLGAIKGLTKFIKDNWYENIDPTQRSIWMVDSSRNKFLIRATNAWVVDIDGEKFQEITLDKIYKIFMEYMVSSNRSPSEMVQTMEFICDIKNKQMVIKALKDAGKYLIYDKEKYKDEEIDKKLAE